MNVAITGGTGFVGSHLARRIGNAGHDCVLVARGTRDPHSLLKRDDTRFVAASVTDREALCDAFADCEAVAHLAGINYERGTQTYENVHVTGTRTVVEAAADAGVSKVLLTSYLRARPDCNSGYHESKWEAERIVRESDLEYTVVKPGIVYGPGDQMVWAITRSLATAPVFPRIGFDARWIRPVAIADLVGLLAAATVQDRLSNVTVPVTGPEELTVTEFVDRVGEVIGRTPRFVPLPVWTLSAGARIQTRVMETPIVTRAGVRMLAEGATEPAPARICDPLPDALEPTRDCSLQRIEASVPDSEPLGVDDLRV